MKIKIKLEKRIKIRIKKTYLANSILKSIKDLELLKYSLLASKIKFTVFS